MSGTAGGSEYGRGVWAAATVRSRANLSARPPQPQHPPLLSLPAVTSPRAHQFKAEGHKAPAGVSDEELWDAKKTVSAIIHPATGEEMFLPGLRWHALARAGQPREAQPAG